MNLDHLMNRYMLDARTFEEKNARSLARGKELLAAGKTSQAMRMFAYNHALNQNKPKDAPTTAGTKWKVRVWKNNKVVKTLTLEKDDEASVIAKVKSLGIDWDKATVHDPKTIKQTKKYANPNATKNQNSKEQKLNKYDTLYQSLRPKMVRIDMRPMDIMGVDEIFLKPDKLDPILKPKKFKTKDEIEKFIKSNIKIVDSGKTFIQRPWTDEVKIWNVLLNGTLVSTWRPSKDSIKPYYNNVVFYSNPYDYL